MRTRRLAWPFVVCLLMSPMASLPAAPTGAQERPEGVPSSAKRATVVEHLDGDKIEVALDGEQEVVLLAGVDAPDPNECFADEAAEYVTELVPNGTTVYLERSGEDKDGKDRLIRYVWIPRENAKAYLLNTKLVREGYAAFDDGKDTPKYFDNLAEAEGDAREKEAGLWGDCGGPHEAVLQPTARSTETVARNEESGTPGYSRGIGQSRTDWEADHGEPNPEFSNGLDYYGQGPDSYFTIGYWDGNVWHLDGYLAETGLAEAQSIARSYIPLDSVFMQQYEENDGITTLLVEVYQSASLVERFSSVDADPWGGEVPGTFIIIYMIDVQTGVVWGWLIGTGNNP